MANRSLVLAYSRAAGDDRAAGAPPGLRVGPGARWVEAPGAPRLDLKRRPVLRRVFAALLECYARDPRASLDAETLFRAGWPGEKASFESALNRVYVSICRLRKLGLADYIATGGAGFQLCDGSSAEPATERANREPPRSAPTLSARERALITATVAAVKHACGASGIDVSAATDAAGLADSIEVAEQAYARAVAALEQI